MKSSFKIKAISSNLDSELARLRLEIKKQMGIELNQLQVSKVASWKLRNSQVILTKNVLSEILLSR
jgi:hypothetical protein